MTMHMGLYAHFNVMSTALKAHWEKLFSSFRGTYDTVVVINSAALPHAAGRIEYYFLQWCDGITSILNTFTGPELRY